MFFIGWHKVSGLSMKPPFDDGDYVIGFKFFKKKRLKEGAIVIVDHPQFGRCIKKVLFNRTDSESISLVGTSEASLSSEALGLLPYQNIRSRIFLHISKASIQWIN